ncbi:SNF2 family N-terminal domain-containing protein [Pholiota molesta]|nr:SNF2 family N-terminal domain-containing protein [Pholiota molesta]
MTVSHVVGYSRSTRAKCHAPTPCKDTPMPVGTLRYGRTVSTETGETVQWRHWGCVTPNILAELAAIPDSNITGFESLKPQDKNKIKLAISLRRIDPADVPPSARVAAPVNTAPPVQRKRSATQAGLSQTSQIATQSTPGSSSFPTTQQTQEEEPEEEPRDELYCTFVTSVVGIQYYKGLVGPGEEVLLVREPHNPYDRNAIQIKNISRVQVGHLPRNVALKLAPLLDRRAVTVEGVINDGNLGSRVYTLSITLKIYGLSDKRRELEPVLVWATPGQRGFNTTSRPSTTAAAVKKAAVAPAPIPLPSQQAMTSANARSQQEAAQKYQESLKKAAELKQILNSLEKVEDDGRRSSLLDTLCSTEDVLNMPVHENPPGIASGELTVDLLKHQLQALKWCIERENPVLPKTATDTPVQFWQLRERGNQRYYYNIATKTPQEAPPLGRGALCADAMGLGKTLTMIALILATKNEVDSGFSNSTLIVSPLSVLSNWEKQILDHCIPGTLKTCIYYGPKKGLSALELRKYDVVITTYQTVVGEHDGSPTGSLEPSQKKKKGLKALFEIPWKRVILDEGHTIRNPKTKMAQAVVALNASRRWVLTGTPIINSPRDLGSLLTFLQICRPLDNEDFYKRLLLRPLKNGDTAGAELLRALMSHICIRRTKEMQDSTGKSIIELPPVEMIKVPVELSEEARRLYDEVEEVSKQRLQNFINAGTGAVVQSTNVLSMLTRMRQIALHPGLIPASYLQELRKAEANDHAEGSATFITPAEKQRLRELLAQAIEDCEECPICFGVLPNDARITSCAHMFCLACITEIISRDPKCPMDRYALTMNDLHEPPPPTDLTQRPAKVNDEEDESEGIRGGSSAKIDQLVHLLKLTPGSEKSLVFSQFTTFLDKIAESLDREGIPYVRFDGKMSAKRRQEAMLVFLQTRKTRNKNAAILDDDGEGNDSDFVMDGEESEDYIETNDTPFSGYEEKRKGKGKSKAVSYSRNSLELGFEENPKVMLLSLKAGALGLNLTVANNVYLMDPWWQEGIESQAIDRVNRIGQKKPVHVYQLIAENTMESKVLEIQEKKKQLIHQAFSGIKRTETLRQQREARLQDLIELFGIRNSQSS